MKNRRKRVKIYGYDDNDDPDHVLYECPEKMHARTKQKFENSPILWIK